MPDVKGLDNLYLVIGFFVPGLIAYFVRAQYVTVYWRTHTDNLLTYLAISLVYYSFALPLIQLLLSLGGWLKAITWIALIIVGPAIFGLLMGALVQFGWVRRLAQKVGLNPLHAIPTSWDWKFSAIEAGSFIMVTLGDGSTLAGRFSDRSFASTDPAERDVYIEEIWDVSDEGEWQARDASQGVLIPAKEIRYVEFWD